MDIIPDHYYCGICGIDCSALQYQEGAKWQKYGDWTQNDWRWIYLCRCCNRTLWRMFAKFEEDMNDLDRERFYKEYMLYLKSEIPKLRSR